MDNKSILSIVTEKILDASNNKSDFIGKFAKIVTNPGSPDKIINIAKDAIAAGIGHLQKNNEELKKFENEAAQTRKEVDNLEQMVQANWQKIKKCGSNEEYLQEEERMAQLLEEQLRQQPQSQQQKHIGS